MGHCQRDRVGRMGDIGGRAVHQVRCGISGPRTLVARHGESHRGGTGGIRHYGGRIERVDVHIPGGLEENRFGIAAEKGGGGSVVRDVLEGLGGRAVVADRFHEYAQPVARGEHAGEQVLRRGGPCRPAGRRSFHAQHDRRVVLHQRNPAAGKHDQCGEPYAESLSHCSSMLRVFPASQALMVTPRVISPANSSR